MRNRFCPALAVLVVLFAVGAGAGETAKRKFALVHGASGTPFGEKLLAGFKAAVEERGGECVVRTPGDGTAEAQAKAIGELAADGVAAIGVSAIRSPLVETALAGARRAGVKIVSVDAPAPAGARDLHVNAVDAELVGRTLVRGALEMAGDKAEFAILSSNSRASNQNMWIDWMKRELTRNRYDDFKLVKTVYGDDDPARSALRMEKLLEDVPNLKVVVAPTTVGLAAAARVVEERNLAGKVLVTGLGFPSEMARYVENGVCPWFYLWNPEDLGYLAGQAAAALVDKSVTGMLGEYFVAGRLGARTIVQAGDGGVEVKLGAPFRFDAENIGSWKSVY